MHPSERRLCVPWNPMGARSVQFHHSARKYIIVWYLAKPMGGKAGAGFDEWAGASGFVEHARASAGVCCEADGHACIVVDNDRGQGRRMAEATG